MTFSKNNRKSLENSVTRFSYLMMIRFPLVSHIFLSVSGFWKKFLILSLLNSFLFSERFRIFGNFWNTQFVDRFPFFFFFFTHFWLVFNFIKELSICHKLWFSNSFMIFIIPHVIWNEILSIFLNLKSSAKLSCEF